MQYTIIGRIVDERFDNKEEDIAGYYVIDDKGIRNFGTVRKIYQLYKEGKLKGVKDFNTNNGAIDFSNTDNSLLPKYSLSLFNSMGNNSSIVCSVIEANGQYKLRGSDGTIQSYTKDAIVAGVKNGSIRLNNATVSNETLSINKAMSILEVTTKNGNQVSYKVALPDGSIKELSKADVIEKLIKEQGLQLFNAKIDGNGNIIAKSGTLPTKALDGIKQVTDIKYTDTFYLFINGDVKGVTVTGKYSGSLKNGKPHGKGTFTSSDYNITFRGEYVDGIKQGLAMLSWLYENYFIYKGMFDNNYCDGTGSCELDCNISGTRFYEYIGAFKKGRPIKGSINYPCNAEKYYYSFDAETGLSTFKRDGATYIGKFTNFVLTGYGKLIKTDSSVSAKNYTYVGNFGERGSISFANKVNRLGGIPAGKGILTRLDGTKIECDNWETAITDKLKSCKITFKNGDTFMGNAIVDIENETGVVEYTSGKMIYSNGNVYTGTWRGTLQNGFGTMNYVNGTTYTGMWKDGKPFGRGVYTFTKTVKGKKVKATEYGIWDGTKKNNKVKAITLLSQIYNSDSGRIEGYKVSIDGVQKEMSCVELMTIDKTKYCVLNDCFDTLFYIQDMKIQAYQELSDDLVSSIQEPLVCIFPAAEELGLYSEVSGSDIIYYDKDNNKKRLPSYLEKYANYLTGRISGRINRATDLILPLWHRTEDMISFITKFKVSGLSYNCSEFRDLLKKEFERQCSNKLPYNFYVLDTCTTECKDRYANSENGTVLSFDTRDGYVRIISYVSKNVDAMCINARWQHCYIYYKAFHDCAIDICRLKGVDILDEKIDIGDYFKNCHIHTLAIDGKIGIFKGLSDKERQAKYNYTIDNIISNDFCSIQKRIPDNKVVLKLEEPICDDTGILLGYTIRKPDGEIIRLRCDDICKLASNPNVSFEDELCTNCCTVRKKRDDGVVLEVNPLNLSVYTNDCNVGADYTAQLNYVITHFKYIIVPSNCCELCLPYGRSDKWDNSSIETIIMPSIMSSHLDYSEPIIPVPTLTNLKYSNIKWWPGWYYSFFNEAYKNMLLKLNGGIVSTDNGRDLYIVDDAIVKDGVFEVPDGVESVFVSPELTRSVKHLILPTTDFSFDIYYAFDEGLCDSMQLYSIGCSSVRENEDYSYYDYSFFDTLESITFKAIGVVSDFYDFANGIRNYNSKLKIYVSPEDYRQLEKRPPNVYCKE